MHFSVTIVHTDKQDIEDLLAPFDESLEVLWVKSKEQHIKESRRTVTDYEESNTYRRYLDDPEEYRKRCYSEAHFKYLSEEFPLQLKWTDEQHYEEAVRYHDEETIHLDGSTMEKYNPNGKWDWYVIGGRWDKQIRTRLAENVNTTPLKFVNWEDTPNTYALIMNGKWTRLDKEAGVTLKSLLKDVNENAIMTIVDIHS